MNRAINLQLIANCHSIAMQLIGRMIPQGIVCPHAIHQQMPPKTGEAFCVGFKEGNRHSSDFPLRPCPFAVGQQTEGRRP